MNLVCPWLGVLTPFDLIFDPQGRCVADRLNVLSSRGPLFVPSVNQVLGALDYERCVAGGAIPTRDVAHDWFNGLVWLRYRGAKALINRLHLEWAARTGERSANGRCRVRDALTLWDESGALLLTREASVADALLAHDWQALFVDKVADWRSGDIQLAVFGHGLLDAMQCAHKGLCAKVVPVVVTNVQEALGQLDEMLCELIVCLREPANFSPLPVMGVPGWFDVSRGPDFYEDRSVFREKPTHQVDSLSKRLAFVWDGFRLVS